MSHTPSKTKSLLPRLAIDELGFCCMYSFVRETNRWSQKKVAAAMGVSAHAIRYWRDKKLTGQITMCPNCRHPQTLLELNRRANGNVYFSRCHAPTTDGTAHSFPKKLV